jgi:hypothetical protein
LREGERRQADQHHAARPEAVEDEAHRHLHACVDQQLEHRERRQLGSGDAEPLGCVKSSDGERRAVEDGEQVDRETDEPDGDGTLLASHLVAHRDSLGR